MPTAKKKTIRFEAEVTPREADDLRLLCELLDRPMKTLVGQVIEGLVKRHRPRIKAFRDAKAQATADFTEDDLIGSSSTSSKREQPGATTADAETTT